MVEKELNMEKIEQLKNIISKQIDIYEKSFNKWVVHTQERPWSNDKINNVAVQLDENIIQKIPLDVDAFNLNPPQAGLLTNIPNSERENPLIIRLPFDNDLAEKIINNPEKNYLIPTIYLGISLIRKIKGYDENTLTVGTAYATFLINDKLCLLYNESVHVYELRLYSNCTKAIIKE